MNSLFWQRMHGGATHFPLVLMLASVVFDFVAWRSRDETLRCGLNAAGLGSAFVGVLGGAGAVISGLVMSRGEMIGNGAEKLHHLFVWPAFGMCVVLVAWRFSRRGHFSPRGLGVYLVGMSIVSVLMLGAGYWGGEMLLGAENRETSVPASIAAAAQTAQLARGHDLFLINCAHCHGDEGHGDGPDEGADLRDLHKSDARVANIIHNGIKGEMPRFGSKFADGDIRALTVFIRSLH